MKITSDKVVLAIGWVFTFDDLYIITRDLLFYR